MAAFTRDLRVAPLESVAGLVVGKIDGRLPAFHGVAGEAIFTELGTVFIRVAGQTVLRQAEIGAGLRVAFRAGQFGMFVHQSVTG